MKKNKPQADTPRLNVYTVLSMAERELKDSGYGKETRRHNAIVLEKTRPLIEYAPELLEACKQMIYIESVRPGSLPDKELKMIRQTIAKAEGRV